MKLETGERLEDLQCNGLQIVQNKNLYCFTSDSVVLANFVKTKTTDMVAEIGSGCGVISILVQAKNNPQKIFAFEIQKQMFDLAKKNIILNKLDEKIKIICDDVKNFENYFQKETLDVVFSNPPFFKATDFQQNDVKRFAKEEILLPCQDLVKVANEMLKVGGAFYCCYTSDRACEIITLCQNNNLKIKEMFFTENGKGTVKLLVLKAIKGGKNGVKVFPNLITNDENGDYINKLKTKMFLS